MFRVQVLERFLVRVQRRVVEQAVGQWLEAGLAGNLCTGATLRLVRQVQVLKAGLGVGLADLLFQFRGQLFLLADRLEDGVATLLHVAQVAQALFQVTQLGVVEATGGLLAVTGDEGHGGAFVEQRHRCLHLARLAADFRGDDVFNTAHGNSLGQKLEQKLGQKKRKRRAS